MHPRDLYRWRDTGAVVELSRGVFRRADAPLASYPDLPALAYRVPRAIVCGLTAAAVHELTDAFFEMSVPAQRACTTSMTPSFTHSTDATVGSAGSRGNSWKNLILVLAGNNSRRLIRDNDSTARLNYGLDRTRV